MNSSGILYLTVSGTGQVRSHDTAHFANTEKRPDEVRVDLSLTRVQIAAVVRAEIVAKGRSGTEARRVHSGTSASSDGY